MYYLENLGGSWDVDDLVSIHYEDPTAFHFYFPSILISRYYESFHPTRENRKEKRKGRKDEKWWNEIIGGGMKRRLRILTRIQREADTSPDNSILPFDSQYFRTSPELIRFCIDEIASSSRKFVRALFRSNLTDRDNPA